MSDFENCTAGGFDLADRQECPSCGRLDQDSACFALELEHTHQFLVDPVAPQRAAASTLESFPHSGPGGKVVVSRVRTWSVRLFDQRLMTRKNLGRQAEETDGNNRAH